MWNVQKKFETKNYESTIKVVKWDGADAKPGPGDPPLEHQQSLHNQPICSRHPYLSGIYTIWITYTIICHVWRWRISNLLTIDQVFTSSISLEYILLSSGTAASKISPQPSLYYHIYFFFLGGGWLDSIAVPLFTNRGTAMLSTCALLLGVTCMGRRWWEGRGAEAKYAKYAETLVCAKRAGAACTERCKA